MQGEVIVLLGNGDGTFAAPARVPMGVSFGLATGCLAVANLDRDHRPDLVTVGDLDLSVLINTTR